MEMFMKKIIIIVSILIVIMACIISRIGYVVFSNFEKIKNEKYIINRIEEIKEISVNNIQIKDQDLKRKIVKEISEFDITSPDGNIKEISNVPTEYKALKIKIIFKNGEFKIFDFRTSEKCYINYMKMKKQYLSSDISELCEMLDDYR
jgi:cell division protein FtsI/penicillin-binding protein 2